MSDKDIQPEVPDKGPRSLSQAATMQMAENAVQAVPGMGLSHNDLSDELLQKLESAMQPTPGWGLTQNNLSNERLQTLEGAVQSAPGLGLSHNDYTDGDKQKVSTALQPVAGMGLSHNDYTDQDKNKLGTALQPVEGMGLSHNDYSDQEKAKVTAAVNSRVVLYANTAAANYTGAAVPVAGLSFEALPNAKYEIEILFRHTSNAALGGLVFGLAPLPAGAKQALDANVVVGSTGVLTTGRYFRALLASGDLIAAVTSNSALPNLGTLKGLIEMGNTGGTIQVLAGAAGTLPSINLAIGDATMRARRISG